MNNKIIWTKHGQMLVNTKDLVVSRSLLEYGEYFESEVSLFEQLVKPSQIVVDVGANIGAHTVALARLVGPTGAVVAIEPQRITHQILCANVAINNLPNVTTFELGAGETQQSLKSYEMDYEKEQNFGGYELRSTGTTNIQVFPLDLLLGANPISFIKIDVEGMELEVLKGATNVINLCRPVLYVENDREENSEELLNLLYKLNYRVYWSLTRFFNPDNFLKNQTQIHTEAFFKLESGKLVINGFAINLLCVPKELNYQIELPEVTNSKEHPCKTPELLAPGLPVLDFPAR